MTSYGRATHVAAGLVWNDRVGPFYATDGVRDVLGGVSKQAVSERVATGRLLALRLAGTGRRGRLVYPLWQFEGHTLELLPTVLELAGYDVARTATGWTIASWLRTPDPSLDGMTCAALLAAGSNGPVLARARDVRAALGVDERAAAAS